MRAKYKHILSLLLALFLLLSCAACGQTQVEQPEDTGDKDQYMTEPVPEGKPNPVEPQDTTVDTTTTHRRPSPGNGSSRSWDTSR